MKRFWDKCQGDRSYPDHANCWIWTGARNAKGYGRFGLNGKNERAHKVAYQLVYGPIPTGKWVLHRCDNPGCCNPTHLFLGTPLDNILDMMQKGRRVSTAGEAHPQAKITTAQAASIRSSDLTSSALAQQYGLTTRAIRYIRAGVLWQ